MAKLAYTFKTDTLFKMLFVKYPDLLKQLVSARTVVISIINFPLFNCKEFHSEFRLLETTRHELLSDNMSLHFFELKKLPKEVNANNMLLLWLALFKAETEEELKQIESMEVPIMNQAINAYHHITVTPEFKEAERLREMARHNEAAALRNERNETAKEIARNALQMNLPVESIVQLTGLKPEEIKAL